MRLRVIAGSLGSRLFDAPVGSKTHPMSEKARGAIFNVLGDIEGLSLLDAYSGSGAIAIEAVSRGARGVVAIDSDKKASQTIRQNVDQLGVSIKVTQANISSWLDRNSEMDFDIVVCDPPYNAINKVHLNKLVKVVKIGGTMVISLPNKYLKNLNDFDNDIALVTSKNYNDAILAFYRRIG